MQQQHPLRAAAGLHDTHMRQLLARCTLFGSHAIKTYSRYHSRQQASVAAAAATHAADASSKSSSRRAAPKQSAATRPDQSAFTGGGPVAGTSLMIVESPTKASKIQKFLGESYKVVASYGHVRDLINKPGAVDPAADFNLVWAVAGKAGESRLQEIAAAASGCGSVLLATDPDREGEAISWHLTQELQRRGVLRPSQTLARVTFTEVTQKAVTEALQHPRQVSDDLVDAYLARRALDYLLGFGLSPLLWRRLGPAARSAGRVQSVALRLVCEREDAVQLFVPEEYWSMQADFALTAPGSSIGTAATPANSTATAATLPAKLVEVDGQKLLQLTIKTQQQAQELVHRLWQQQQPNQPVDLQQLLLPPPGQAPVWYTVKSVVKRPVRRNPPPPLVTSTLQQEAARRLGFSASKTMQVAQQLYEGANTGEGLITYMRTDGVSLSTEAVDALRGTISQVYGDSHLPAGGPRVLKSRAKNAQEAHEAIRPTNPELMPGTISDLTPDQANLYSLVWRRAMASQMESAELQQVSAEFVSPCGSLLLRCTGSSLSSPGWLAAWADWEKAAAATDDNPDHTSPAGDLSSTDDDDDLVTVAAGDGKSASSNSKAALSQLLQQLQEGQQVLLAGVSPNQHFTKPPPRYTEASMVKTLEELGVGRPSTYAPIIRKLLERGYVVKSGRTIVPTPLGRLLTAYLTIHFNEYVDVNFTAKVEEQLDEVSAGELPWKELMREFWGPLEQAMASAQAVSTAEVFNRIQHQLEHLIFMPPKLPAGASAAAADASSGTATTTSSSSLQAAGQDGLPAAFSSDPHRCPVCGGELVLKPSRAVGGFIGCSNFKNQGCTFGRPLWPDLEEAANLSDEEEAVAAAAAGGAGGLLGVDKLLGHQPGTDLPVLLKRGPFGLYVQLGEGTPSTVTEQSSNGSSAGSSTAAAARSKGRSKVTRATLPRLLNWNNTTLEEALRLLALPRTVGEHPDDGEPVLANSGRFGPYVVHKTLYAPLPKGMTPQEVTFEEAVELLAAKAARMRARGRDPYAEKPKKGKKTAADKKSSSKDKETVSSKKAEKRRSKAHQSTSSTDGGSSSSSRLGRITGYNLFTREMRPSIAAAAANADGSSGRSILSLIAAAWGELTDEQKAEFNERARQLNGALLGPAPASTTGPAARSSRSRGAGTSTASASNNSSEVGATGAHRRSFSTGAATTSSRSRTRTKQFSAYQLFCQQQRGPLLAAKPGLKPTQVMSELAATWNQLSAEEKAAYSSTHSAAEQQPQQSAAAPTQPLADIHSDGHHAGGNSSPEQVTPMSAAVGDTSGGGSSQGESGDTGSNSRPKSPDTQADGSGRQQPNGVGSNQGSSSSSSNRRQRTRSRPSGNTVLASV